MKKKRLEKNWKKTGKEKNDACVCFLRGGGRVAFICHTQTTSGKDLQPVQLRQTGSRS